MRYTSFRVPEKIATSFRLSEEALRLLKRLAEADAIDRTDVLEILIREKARARGIATPEERDS